MVSSRRIAAGVLILLAISILPILGDEPESRLSSYASIGRAETPVSLTAAPAGSQSTLAALKQLATAVPDPADAPSRGALAELVYGAVAASCTHLCCFLGVFRI